MLSREEKRILDVNRNRITEGLRVVEDILRFTRGASCFAKKIKKTRHQVFDIFDQLEDRTGIHFIAYRDTLSDKGRKEDYDKVSKNKKTPLPSILRRNLRRVCEGIRVSEEITKSLEGCEFFLMFKKLRFAVYDFEKELDAYFTAKAKSCFKKC